MRKEEPGSVDPRVKNWNHLLASDAPFQVKSIRVIESDIFEAQAISLPRAVALVGLHGTGKTLLLRMLEAAFGHVSPLRGGPPFFRGRHSPYPGDPALIGGSIEVTLKTPDGLVAHVVDLSEPAGRRAEIWAENVGSSYSVGYAGPLQAFDDLVYTFQEYRSVAGQERISWELSAGELSAVRNVLGRSYERLALDTATIEGSAAPYFHGSYQSKEIDFAAMSSGELWVHYINWWLHRLPEGSLALIDEPEAFLAVRGRRPFVDQIALQALRHKRQLIVATHSPEILARFPMGNIRMCVAGDKGIRVVEPTSLLQIQDIVGMGVPVRGLVMVEDSLAKQLLQGIFAQYDVALTREIETVAVGGAAEVVAGLRILQSMSRLAVVGVLDADQQSNAVPGGVSLLYLPGQGGPEEELLSAARREGAWIAENLGRAVDDVEVAVNSCQSLDHQYRLRYLASQLGQPESALIFVLTRAWLRDAHVGSQAEELVRNVRESMMPKGRMFSA